MNVQSYFKSLSEELHSLKDRVRNFMDSPHWLTDGEWKESVIRSFLKRNLPRTVDVGRGFIINGREASHQIDILIHDNSKPVLFRDGDLVFVTPDVVKGIIEVKSKLNSSNYTDAIERLCSNANIMRSHNPLSKFAALFSFEVEHDNNETYLDILANIANTPRKTIDFIALGDSTFIKYWEINPENPKRLYYRWHSYRLHQMAAGYFFHNIIDSLSPNSVFQNTEVWFPSEGKEPYKDREKCAKWCKNET